MTVIRTDQWLIHDYDDPIKMCKKLEPYFDGASATEIYMHLIMHGMYDEPLPNGLHFIKRLQRENIWDIVQTEEKQLQQQWNTPNIPIFIFPSNPQDQTLKKEYNGIAGITFSDKLFLFVSKNNDTNKIRALFTHEYNHVCRLTKYEKKEWEYTLLDTIILEGLAENAVRERMGESYISQWTSFYSDEKLNDIWKNVIHPHKDILRTEHQHEQILYGNRLYPKMAGYCVGYYLVKTFMNKNKVDLKDLMDYPSEKIAHISEQPPTN